MSTLSVGKVRVLEVLSIILAIIVAIQGVVLYKIAKNYTALPQPVAVATSPAKTPNHVGPNLWIGASPGLWNSLPSLSEDLGNQVTQFHNRMDQLFNDTFSQPGLSGAISNDFTVPSMDLRDEKDHYTVQMDMPGADKGTIKVNVEGRLLSVSGQRDTSNETKDAQGMIKSERSSAEFERSITLPTDVKADAVNADYTNGVLTINLQKANTTTEATNVTVH